MVLIVLITLLSCLLTACSAQQRTVIPPTPASEKSVKLNCRKTQEVLLVACQYRDVYVQLDGRSGYNHTLKTIKDKQGISIVDTTDTRERFEVNGCYGKSGDRFKISC